MAREEEQVSGGEGVEEEGDVAGQESGIEDTTEESGSEPGFVFRGDIPGEWEGKSPEEIKSLWNSAASMLKQKLEENEALQAALAEAKKSGRKPRVQEPEPKPDPNADKDLRELILDDPEAAFDRELRKRLGPQLKEFEEVKRNTAMITARSSLPDFDRYEDTVTAILESSAGPVTAASVRAAYLMAKGLESVETDRKNKRKKQTSDRPAKPDKGKEEKPSLGEMEKQVAKAMGMNEEEYLEYRDQEFTEVEIPGAN